MDQANPGIDFEIFRPKDHNLKRWGLAAFGGVTLLLTTLFSVLIILNTYTALLRHGRAVLLNKLLPFLPLIIIGISLGIFLILWVKNHWEDRMVLGENELIEHKGKKQRVWAYEETQRLDTAITNIQFGGSIVGTRVKLLLEDGDQRQWIIHNRYENMAELIDSIRSRILPHTYKKAIYKISQGKKIIFHSDLKATKTGFEVKDQHIPWGDGLQPIQKNNHLILPAQDDADPLFKANVKKIKNLDLLLCLFDNPPIFEN